MKHGKTGLPIEEELEYKAGDAAYYQAKPWMLPAARERREKARVNTAAWTRYWNDRATHIRRNTPRPYCPVCAAGPGDPAWPCGYCASMPLPRYNEKGHLIL